MNTDKPIALAPGEGKTMIVLGTTYTIKVAGVSTGGAFCLIEFVVPPQAGVPPHLHQREKETFYILEGTMEVQCAGQTITATAGTTVTLPKKRSARLSQCGECSCESPGHHRARGF